MNSKKPSRVLLVVAVMITCLAWSAAAWLWLRLGESAFAVSVFGLGLSLGPCLAAYALVPGARKQAARRAVQAESIRLRQLVRLAESSLGLPEIA